MVLREKRLEDAPDDYAWRTDPELARLDATSPLSVPYSAFLRSYQEELEFPSAWSHRFSIDSSDGKHIGNCMYYDIDRIRGQAELGIMVGNRDYWSKGYGTEAVTILLEHIFSHTSLKRVYLHTLDWNTRAQRCFQKCGFREVKRVRRNGLNFVFMEVWRREWEQRLQNQSLGGDHPQQEQP